MAVYTCPVCQKQIERDLVRFLSHTDEHVIEVIKQKHPEWVESDGICHRCYDYYRKQLRGTQS